ncbi:MAG: GAF domain-containing protein [Anaerolineales bacterium]|nr:GAF domain-containing protein [Anaerolineales bacterium]
MATFDRSPGQQYSVTEKTIEAIGLTNLKWKQSFTKLALRVGTILGLVIAISSGTLGNQPIRIAIYIASYLLMGIAAFTPTPYWLNASVTAGIFAVLGFVWLVDYGIYGGAVAFLVVFTVLVTLLFNQRAGITSGGITALLMLILGVFIVNRQIPLQAKGFETYWGDMGSWFSYIILFLVTAITINSVLTMALKEYNAILERAKATFDAMLQEREDLEKVMVNQREVLNRKTAQLETAAYITRQIAMVQDLKTLLEQVTKLISEEFNYYHAGIYFIDTKNEFFVLQAASSQTGIQLVDEGYKLAVSNSGIIGYLILNKRPRLITRDFMSAVNENWFPDTLSQLMIPLVVREQVIGIIDLHSTAPGAFTDEDMDTLQTISDQLAITIDNVRLLGDSRLIIQQLEAISSERTRWAWSDYLRKQKKGYRYTVLGIEPVSKDNEPGRQKNEGKHPKLDIPISLRGQTIGKIIVNRKGKNSDWTDRELEFTSEIAAQIGLALENARLFDETSRRAERERLVGEITSKIRTTTDPDKMIQMALEELKGALGVSQVELIPHKVSKIQEE